MMEVEDEEDREISEHCKTVLQEPSHCNVKHECAPESNQEKHNHSDYRNTWKYAEYDV